MQPQIGMSTATCIVERREEENAKLNMQRRQFALSFFEFGKMARPPLGDTVSPLEPNRNNAYRKSPTGRTEAFSVLAATGPKTTSLHAPPRLSLENTPSISL